MNEDILFLIILALILIVHIRVLRRGGKEILHLPVPIEYLIFYRKVDYVLMALALVLIVFWISL